jgi:hypothetical protein
MLTLLNLIAALGGIAALYFGAVTLGHRLAAAFQVPDRRDPVWWLAKMEGRG